MSFHIVPNSSRHGKHGQTQPPHSLVGARGSKFAHLNLENLEDGLEEVYVDVADLGSQICNIPKSETSITFTSSAHLEGESRGSKKTMGFKPKSKGTIEV